MFFCSDLLGQEYIRKDTLNSSLKNDTEMKLLPTESPVDRLRIKDYEPEKEIRMDSIKNLEFNFERPFYVPVYYVNQSPMFFGDYSTNGLLLPNIYGYGSQTTIPGIGRVNQMSFMYHRQINAYFDFGAGVNAAKYSFPYSTGQSFGVFGNVTYHPTDRFRINAFGSYSPDGRYNFNNSSYGATLEYDITERFGVEMGVRRYYDNHRGWQTAPVAVPYYKFDKFNLGIDVGGILYEIIRGVKNNKPEKMMRPIPMINRGR